MFKIFNKTEQWITDFEPIRAIEVEEINGEYSLDLIAQHNTNLVEGNFVGYVDGADLKLFEIQTVNQTLNDVEIYAVHVSKEMQNDYIEDLRPTGSAETVLNAILANSRWVVGTVSDLGSTQVHFYEESVYSGLAKVANAFNGELQFTIEFSGNAITARKVHLLERRGTITGKRFEYDKDIVEMVRSVDTSDLITACYGFGKGETIISESGETSYGRRINFADVVWTTPTNPANKPLNQKYVVDTASFALWARDGRHRFGKATFDDIEDESDLLTATWEYLQAHSTPKISYKMGVLVLGELTGYEHEKVELGDTVAVINADLGLTVSARVLSIKKDLLEVEQSQVVLANFIDTFTGTVRDTVTVVNRFRDKQGAYDDGAQRAIDGLTDSGYVGLPIAGGRIVGTELEDGLNFNDTYMGYYNLAQDAWRAYIDKTGKFLFQKDVNSYFMYNGTDFEFKGPVTITAGSGYANLTDKPDLSIYAESSSLGALAGLDLIDWDYLDATVITEIDGKITTWYTDTDPNTWAVADRPKHDGDLWYHLTNKTLSRYNSSTNTWQAIEDQDAIDAMTAASTAQDTADGKRRVFVTTPTVPYDVGDLWVEGSGGDIKRCAIERLTGAYQAGDWELASKYTDDSATTALENSLGSLAYQELVSDAMLDETVLLGGYIKTTLIDVANIFATNATITSLLSIGANIKIDGVNNKLFSGTGTYGNINTGWYLDNLGRFSLKDKLTWDGSALAINGAITSNSGSIGGWAISSNGITAGSTHAGAKGMLSGNDIAFYAGNLSPAAAPFKVTQAGALTSTSGSIGGWDITSDTIESTDGTIVLSSLDKSFKITSSEIFEEELLTSDFEIGTISTSTGANVASRTRIRSGFYPVTAGDNITATITTGYQVYLYRYTSTKTFMSATGWSSSLNTTIPTAVGYVRFVIRKTDDSNTRNWMLGFSQTFNMTQKVEIEQSEDNGFILKRGGQVAIGITPDGVASSFTTKGVVDGKDVRVTISPEKPFELVIDGQKHSYIKDGKFITSKYDVTESGIADYTDIGAIRDYLLSTDKDNDFNSRFDVNNDGIINTTDLAQAKLNAVSFPEIKTGNGTASVGAVNTWTTITFSSEMTTTPKVTVTANGYDSGSIPTDTPIFRLADITTTGFKISCNIAYKSFNYIAST